MNNIYKDPFKENRYYFILLRDVKPSNGTDFFVYTWKCFLNYRKQLRNLIKLQKKEGWVEITNIDVAPPKTKEGWPILVTGTVNGGTPFEHNSIIHQLLNVIEKK